MAASDIKIRRGANRPDVVWRLRAKDGTPFDGTGSVFVVTIVSGNEKLVRSTAIQGDGLSYDSATGLLRWQRTLEDSRKISPGRNGTWEIERRIDGGQSFIASGAVIGQGTISDD